MLGRRASWAPLSSGPDVTYAVGWGAGWLRVAARVRGFGVVTTFPTTLVAAGLARDEHTLDGVAETAECIRIVGLSGAIHASAAKLLARQADRLSGCQHAGKVQIWSELSGRVRRGASLSGALFRSSDETGAGCTVWASI